MDSGETDHVTRAAPLSHLDRHRRRDLSIRHAAASVTVFDSLEGGFIRSTETTKSMLPLHARRPVA
jgi:hypothetical protein